MQFFIFFKEPQKEPYLKYKKGEGLIPPLSPSSKIISSFFNKNIKISQNFKVKLFVEFLMQINQRRGSHPATILL
ncbi:hypothetical protein BGG33_05010 [Campylobacter lari]|nr:hypothetical protein [Campylobacter lari]EAI4841477.1 hypothetical protein [Campylobacter lari]EAI5467313.1 hypothetical protein [Campylobacter lari]EAI9743532.1 hypothetical protein [Campylobacter lari]